MMCFLPLPVETGTATTATMTEVETEETTTAASDGSALSHELLDLLLFCRHDHGGIQRGGSDPDAYRG